MDIEDLLGFNEFQPLIDFKNMMNIKGLQKNQKKLLHYYNRPNIFQETFQRLYLKYILRH